jgi:hypothetical protein
MMVLRTCEQIEGGLPADVKSKMMFNIVVDFFIGLVPFLGDLADAVFKANTRNAVELEKLLRKRGQARLKAQGQAVPSIDPSDPDEYDRQLRAEYGNPPVYTEDAPTLQRPMQNQPPQSRHVGQASTTTTTTTTQKQGGWFSGFGRNARPVDFEHGMTQDRGNVPTTGQVSGTTRDV